MSHATSRNLKVVLASLAATAVLSLVVSAAVPSGWYLAASKPNEYDVGVDASAVYEDHPSAYLKSKTSSVNGFGTLMQDFTANKYAGKRVRFSANAKTAGVQSWAGLWMRIDKQMTSVVFDNMHDRPIVGTTRWENYSVVLDIPRDATGVFFGILRNGSGALWLNGAKFQVVGFDVPVTASPSTATAKRDDEPKNLDFTKE